MTGSCGGYIVFKSSFDYFGMEDKMAKRFSIMIMCVIFALVTGTAFGAGQQGQAAGSNDDNYPSRPIRLILPVNPGGGMDTTARQWQKYFEQEIGQPLVFESQPGAGTLIGNRAVATANPDGYTLGLISAGDFMFSIKTMDAPYTVDDFAFVGSYYDEANMLWVHKDAPWNNMREFIAWVKTQPPGTVPVSTTTATSVTFIYLKNLEKAAGVKFNIVAFTGGNPARLAVASKEVVATVTGWFNGQMIADSAKVIGCLSTENNIPELTNNAKTLKEEFGVELTAPATYYGMYAPKGFAEKYPQRYEKIVKAFVAAITGSGYYNDLKATGEESKIVFMGPEEAKQSVVDGMKDLDQYMEYF
jgi:tripartite-type tricarboxylate transporter receptor subunit TctC